MKTRICILLAAIALAGCTRSGYDALDSNSISATIDCGISSTKTILVDNPGVRMETRWQGGESIGIFADNADNLRLTINEADISEDGRTAEFNSASGIPSGNIIACSPYQDGAMSASDVITVNFPERQSYLLKDGVVQADPAANILLGSGNASSGITFRNTMAVLKIGQVFDAPTLLKSVEFRDLSGTAVSGEMTLSWNGGNPEALITGSGNTITLDCGEGIQLEAGELGVFFIIVPARSYDKGFELSFTDDAGNRTVRTVGTTLGKTLNRSIVYTIGDIAQHKYIEGAVSELKPAATIMSGDNMDKIRITDTHVASVLMDGRYMEDCEGRRIFMPEYAMIVHRDLNPVQGGWMIFEEGSDDLPNGGVYRITDCVKMNDDYYEVVARPEANPAAAFESLSAGEPMVDGSGVIDEEKGIPLDIASYVRSIVDESGNELYIRTNRDGEIQLSASSLQNAVDAATKATRPHSQTFNSPRLSGNVKSENAELSLGARMTFNTRLALGVVQGSLQYVYLTLNPQITVSESLTIKSEVELNKSFRIFTLTTHPIPVAPGLFVTVEIVFHASLGVGGNMQITATTESTTDLGTYSLSYNSGDGVIFRSKNVVRDVPGSHHMDLSGFEGSVYGSAAIGAKTTVSAWGICGLGMDTQYTLKCGLFSSEGGTSNWTKFAVQPEIEFTPELSTFFYSHKFEDLTTKVELKPLWEKYIIPNSRIGSIIPRYEWTDRRYSINYGTNSALDTYVPTDIAGIDYSITLEGDCYDPLQVVLLVYKGDGIRLTPQSPNDPYGTVLSEFQADGIEHLYMHTYMCDKALTGIYASPSHVLDIGTYQAGCDSKTFEGTAKVSTAQGQAYGVVPAVKKGDGYYILSYGTSADYFNPFIYWWPNRSNGARYESE